MKAHIISRLTLCALLMQFGTISATLAQTIGVPPATLKIASFGNCQAIKTQLLGNESGGQWLIGETPFYSVSNATQTFATRQELFDKVSCYSRAQIGRQERVFVITEDGSSCGWVDETSLLDLNTLGANRNAAPTAVCETPRAMTLSEFCSDRGDSSAAQRVDCAGVPGGLRAKGVLMGSTSEEFGTNYPFMSAPLNGKERSRRFFFSVLEIHEVEEAGDRLMALVGDGEGTMFGWIDFEAIQLWPTRLGLFYDEAGLGRMFQSQRDLILSERGKGDPEPSIQPGLKPDDLSEYVHGELPLLSYPIIRTVDPAVDSAVDDSMPPFHEVIFLGQTGEGSATQLMSEAELAREVDQIQRVNVMIVLDTTESMLDYLTPVQTGIDEFVRRYRARSLDSASAIPKMRIGVYGYSDFVKADKIKIDDPITMAELMRPTRIEEGFDIESALAGVIAHSGLKDSAGGTGKCGPYSEAALEAVAQLGKGFGKNPAWFEDGPRVVIHLADHGSRESSIVRETMARLSTEDIYYIPIAVATDDKGNAQRTCARQDFTKQAELLQAPNVGPGQEANVSTIDFTDDQNKTSATVQDQLDTAMLEVIQAVGTLREKVLGKELARAQSSKARDLASSRFRIDERILEDRGLKPDDIEVIVQASTGFAPAQMWSRGIKDPVAWVYTVALETNQAEELTTKLQAMCKAVGRPEQKRQFRELIVGLAETFSGDKISTNQEVRGVLSELAAIPGARRSLLAEPVNVLLQRADSTDPKVVEELRQDVCWMSYHLTNVSSGFYAQPDHLAWNGRDFVLKQGQQITKRSYIYKPIVGTETLYLPSVFFARPNFISESVSEPKCEFFSCPD